MAALRACVTGESNYNNAGGNRPTAMTIELGAIVKGIVVRIADYGAIVRLEDGQTGLIHISEIADAYVRDVRDYLNENDQVTVRVLRLSNRGRYELSLKQAGVSLAPRPQRELVGAGGPWVIHERPAYSPPPPRPAVTFEDRLTQFLKDSEERQSDLKRNIESKRGRR